MKMKKIDFTKLAVKGTEWFSSLALLNLCWLLASIPIVTIIPATDALFTVLHEWETVEKSTPVFHQFKRAFKRNFKKSYKLGLPLFIGLIIVLIDIYIISHLTILSAWFQILKYGFYTFIFLLILSVLYAYPLMKQMKEPHLRVLTMGLLMAVGHPLISLGVTVSLIILIVIFLFWPGMVFFFGASGTAWLMTTAVSMIIEKDQAKQLS